MNSINSTDGSKTTSQAKPTSSGPTADLCSWIHRTKLAEIPESIQTRAKHLLLDGVACLLVGANLPSSTIAVNALLEIEGLSQAKSSVYGWAGAKVSPLQAALLNSTFIQGFELDDYHSEAPLHSNSLIIPAILAAAECRDDGIQKVTGSEMLLAAIIGYEVGPRVGLALRGTHMLTCGWHSGAVFGPSAAAAASAKLLGLDPVQVEDALGIACTQAGGLMSAQFNSDVKRMQHGFAARNGLLGTLLARRGYAGIKKVYEHEYGGFLSCFSSGNGRDPPYVVEEIARGLGGKWQIEGIRVKAYSAMAGTHATVDCMRKLQEEHQAELADLGRVRSVKIELGEAMFHHGGWEASKPLTATGAQMNNAFVGATQLVDGEVLPPQFGQEALNRDEVWDLVGKTSCVLNDDLGGQFATRVTIEVQKGNDAHASETITAEVPGPRGISPEATNQDIVDKWRTLAATVIDEERVHAIERLVLDLDQCQDLGELADLLVPTTRNPLA
jgi:aconitate decarboxylase